MPKHPNVTPHPVWTTDHARRLRTALAEAARETGVWWDAERQKPMVQINGAPMSIPPMRVSGKAPKLRPGIDVALESFKAAAVAHLLGASEEEHRRRESERRRALENV